ncbi:MAG TPA: hypothetical protein VES42_14835 [Pilimelia sp.]|nr:hypothetical protein [Pilimelia sp.]
MPTIVLVLLMPWAFLFGALAAGVGARLRFIRGGSAFRCKLRWLDSWSDVPSFGWRRGRTRAKWVHDVLLVQRGLLQPRTVSLPVRRLDHAIRSSCPVEVRGLGSLPLILTLRLDDGGRVEVAAREADRTALAGPFLAAAIPGLPRPVNQPWRDRM